MSQATDVWPQPAPMVEIWRGPVCESRHSGFAVVSNAQGEIIDGWGDPEAVILPRSSVKMIQALPLIASGAASAASLTSRQLAFACASHNGDPIHVDAARAWLDALDLTDDDLICGTQEPMGPKSRRAMITSGEAPCRVHNNCSGKHCGFLTLRNHIGGDANYVDTNHPVQRAVRNAFETVTDLPSPGFGIDGCSAPNFATTLAGLGRAMGYFAAAREDSDTLENAAFQLAAAMRRHPEMVAGEGRACTDLMRAAKGKAAIKFGAEGVFTVILPDQKIGIALKITDGATRAANCAIAALLVKYSVVDAQDPLVTKYLNPPVKNWDGLLTGEIKPSPLFTG